MGEKEYKHRYDEENNLHILEETLFPTREIKLHKFNTLGEVREYGITNNIEIIYEEI